MTLKPALLTTVFCGFGSSGGGERGWTGVSLSVERLAGRLPQPFGGGGVDKGWGWARA